MRIVVGEHACREVLRMRPSDVKKISFNPDMLSPETLERWRREFGLKSLPRLEKVPRGLLDKLCSGHQGVAIEVASAPEFVLGSADIETSLFLDGITDPHNLGAIIRSCWIFGAQAVFLPDRRTVSMTPAVTRVASGGAEHVAVEQVTASQNFIKAAQEKGYWVYGLSERGDQQLPDVTFPERTLLVIGGEEKGLSRPIEKQVDVLVRIPQVSPDGDLNASVAAAIALYERRRQLLKVAGK